MQYVIRKALQSHNNVNAELEYYTDRCDSVSAELLGLWRLIEEQAGLTVWLLLSIIEGSTDSWWLVFHAGQNFASTCTATKPGAATLNAALHQPNQTQALSAAFRLGGLDGSDALGTSLLSAADTSPPFAW
jgi:hypothetical protein